MHMVTILVVMQASKMPLFCDWLYFPFLYFASSMATEITQNTRLYVLAQNLFTVTSYKGLDPETQGWALPPLQGYCWYTNRFVKIQIQFAFKF